VSVKDAWIEYIQYSD